MRREGESPARHTCVVENWLKLSLQQARIEEQKKRRAGVGHINRVNRAVAEVLFGKEQRRAVHVGGQLVGRNGLSIGECAKLGVRFSTGRCEISHELSVKLSRARL